jgi:CheY-like chemotaxis protein
MSENRIRKRILVCDDDDILRKALAVVLGDAYDVVLADSGEEALRLIAERAPDLVLLDMSMPGMTGLETLRAYRKTHPQLRTIMLTSKHEIGIARRALEAGAVEYITKPFQAETLKAEVERQLSPPPAADDRPWHVVS